MKALKLAVLSLILPVSVVIIGTMIYDRVESVSSIEYRVTNVGQLLYIPQGLENRVRVDLDGKPHKNMSLIRLELFNRSTKSFSDVPVHVHLKDGTATLLSKLLIYPTEQDSDRFAWNDPSMSNLDFVAKGLNTSWGDEPSVTFNLFFDDGNPPDLVLSTPKAGLVFIPFEPAKYFLFKYDLAIVMALVIAFGLYGFFQIGKALRLAQVDAFIRVFSALYNDEVERSKVIQVTTAKEISGTHVLQAAAVAFSALSNKPRFHRKSDQKTIAKAQAALAKARESEAKTAAEVVSRISGAGAGTVG